MSGYLLLWLLICGYCSEVAAVHLTEFPKTMNFVQFFILYFVNVIKKIVEIIEEKGKITIHGATSMEYEHVYYLLTELKVWENSSTMGEKEKK